MASSPRWRLNSISREPSVEEFGGTVSSDFVHLVEAGPGEERDRLAVGDLEPGLEGAEGDFAVTVAAR